MTQEKVYCGDRLDLYYNGNSHDKEWYFIEDPLYNEQVEITAEEIKEMYKAVIEREAKMNKYFVTVREWEWDSLEDETIYYWYKRIVEANNEEEAKQIALDKVYSEISPPDNELVVEDIYKLL